MIVSYHIWAPIHIERYVVILRTNDIFYPLEFKLLILKYLNLQ